MKNSKTSNLTFPTHRARRLRQTPVLRKLVRQTQLGLTNLVMPYFVKEGKGVKTPVRALPGIYQFSIDMLVRDVSELVSSGVHSILLFGVPSDKNKDGREAFSSKGTVQKAVRALKKEFPSLLIITDVCLCAYMSHGHCGVVHNGRVQNDPSLKLLAKTALSHADAGADIVAPSDMMDGRVGAIRKTLDANGFSETPILSYAAKYASSFYGPFREAAGSSPKFSDRKGYQMDYSNRDEAMKEIALDIQEGADMVMVKPALAYLDVIYEARKIFPVPIAAYNVSGEYAMVTSSEGLHLFAERDMVIEILTAIRRAGASFIISYHTRQLAEWNKKRGPLF